MKLETILSTVDHTQLSVTSTWEDIRKLCDEGIAYHTASVCIPAAYVKQAKEYVKDRLKICTVIGFPNGYSTTASKVFEAADAVKNGAEEVDMVIHVGKLKEGDDESVLNEINAVKDACGNALLKVIVETCLLTEEEKIRACEIVSKSRAEYIKTSTGFSLHGATLEDILLMKQHVLAHTKIKAAGGISSLEDAESFLQNGADRLGTSRIVSCIKNLNSKGETL